MTATSGQLYRLNADGEAVADLLESVDISSDRLTWTMHLHTGLVFSDGSPLTADDVVYAYERIKDSPRTNKVLISTVTGVEAVDPETVVWHLSAPQDELPSWFASGYMPIYPMDQVDRDGFFDNPVSAGPYTVDGWQPNADTTTLLANPRYLHAPAPIQRIEVIYAPDPTTRALQLSQGEFDLVEDLPSVAAALLPEGITSAPNPIGGIHFLIFNHDNASSPVADPNARRAIEYALNREDIAQVSFQGVARPAYTVAAPGTTQAEAAVAAIPNGGQQNLDDARAALAASGYPDGFDVTIQVPADRVGWLDSVLVIQQQLAEIGINVNIQAMEFPVSIANMTQGSYELAFTGAGGFPYTNTGFYGLVLGQGNVIQARSRCTDQELQDDLDQAAIAPADQAAGLYAKAEARNADIVCIIPISERVQLVAQNESKVQGLIGFARNGQFWFIKTAN